MKKFSEKIQEYFIATAFTDVGEFDAAVEILEELKGDQKGLARRDREIPRLHATRV